MQYKVPQDVGIEDKLFFFLTLRQLIICSVGASICYVLYTMFRTLGVVTWLVPSIIIMGITALIAFLRFNMMSFTRLLLAIIELNMLPAKRFFRQIPDPITPLKRLEFIYEQQAAKTPTMSAAPTQPIETDINKISDLLDSHRTITHE